MDLTDSPAGVIDRRGAIRCIGDVAGRPSAGGESMMVVLAQFDDVAAVLESFGADALDLLLGEAHQRIVDTVGDDVAVARLGDGILIVGSGDRRSAQQLADVVRRALLARISADGIEIAVGASVGVSIGDVVRRDGSDDAERLLARSEAAVGAARDTGGRVVVVDEHHPLASSDQLQLAAALSEAMTSGELAIEYQPILDTVSEELRGIEALLRWDRPFHGRMMAADFVGVAEKAGLMSTIGDWILSRACADLRRLIDRCDVDPRLAVHVNVSSSQLSSTGVVRTAVDALREQRLHPSQLVIEVREASLLQDGVEAERCIRALRRVGVRVAVDRFGTGPDSMAVLTDIGADIVKLDRHLALPRSGDETDNEVARAVVLLARSLQMKVVAERVDEVDQLRRLRAAGCDMVQGHLLGRPMPFDDLAALLAAQAGDS